VIHDAGVERNGRPVSQPLELNRAVTGDHDKIGARAKCSTWNNLEICSNAEIVSNGATGDRAKTYEIGTIEQAGQWLCAEKMPLMQLALPTQRVERVSNSDPRSS
jgi:hypothetical protein